jgi:hypothetical protein
MEKLKLKKIGFVAVSLFFAANLQAGESTVVSKETTSPPPTIEDNRWHFLIASPGLLASLTGTVGLNGFDSDIDIDFDEIFNHLDMVFAARMEANKGRFGIYGELIYLSLSASADQDNRLLRSVDVQVDEYLVDSGLSWRLVEKPRFSLDVVAGTRYTNVYQEEGLVGNTPVITTTSGQLVTDISARLRDRLNNAITESGFVANVQSAISARISNKLQTLLVDRQRSPSIPIAILAARHPGAVAGVVERAFRVEEARIRAEVDALGLVGAARAAAVQQRVAAGQAALAQRITAALKKQLNRNFARADYWFDPYVGVRGRYNFNKAFYTAVRTEIGGFGIGSDLMWQTEGVIGCQITRNIFSEIGYRAISFDYDQDGFLFDTITHGPQITTGFTF